jgi:glucose-1-phosphate cytidylyltransferase
MKVAILCGGLGTRLREETEFKPKPMVEIGGRPILWHIMKYYAHSGHREFVLAVGYKGDVIRDYFLHYEIRNRDFTIKLGTRDVEVHGGHDEDGWRVTLAETGLGTFTGGRLLRLAEYLKGGPFMATYGDGVADVDLSALFAYHRKMGKLGTVTAVRPSSRFGELMIEDGIVSVFKEKPQIREGWINGGFFVFEPAVLGMIGGDAESLEQGLLVRLAERGELAVYQHEGFWQCMDTYREMELLNEMWRAGKAPWKTWP